MAVGARGTRAVAAATLLAVGLAVGSWIVSGHVATGRTTWGLPRTFVSNHPTASPLDPLTAAELETTFSVVEASKAFPKGAFFPTVRLQEPPKAEVVAWATGKASSR